ncbi:MAG TPA: flavin reductase family protein [Methanoregulaceae archaeon]|nr:flavin reductase family protein [Methanoregulaceae archaeon]
MMKTLSPDDAFARSAPMVYTVVTCLDELGKPNALGVSWVTRASWSPFLMLVSIDHSRYSHAGIRQNREFVINYPTKEQEKGALVCGMSSGRDIDKTVASGLAFVNSEKVRCPTIDGSAVSFECRVIGEMETGDHTVFVGEVVASKGHPEEQNHLYVTHNFTMLALGNEE